MNVEAFQRALERSGLHAVVGVSQPNVFYTSGAFITTQKSIPDRLALTVLPRDGDDVLLTCNIEESLARNQSWIKDVRSYVEFAQSPISLLADVLSEKSLAAGRIGVEKSYLTAAFYEELVEALPHARFEACDSLFDEVRSTKTNGEIERYKQAGLATERALVDAFREARVGQTERELRHSILDKLTRLGASDLDFATLAAADQSWHAHPPARDRELEPGDLIRVEVGAVFDGYGSDVARMAVVGEASQLQREMYAKHRQVQREAIECMQPGVRACDVFHKCVQTYAELGIECPGPHVGHGFGLGGHEIPMLQPYNTQELRPNMLICIEPVVMLPGIGGFQLEDLVLIREEGAGILTTYADTQELFVIG